MSDLLKDIYDARDFLKKSIKSEIDLAVVLGSGLGELADEIEEAVKIPYQNIPGFPVSTVEGHAGQMVIGKFSGKNVLAMQGRIHYYEGHHISKVVFPARVIKSLGIKNFIVTNAAGSTTKDLHPGDLMIITDHINNLGANPLIGKNIDEFGARFPDMSYVYSRDMIKLAESVAKDLDIEVRKGVYCANSGPTYETPAEIRMMRGWGASAIGMSTVPEVIVAAHAGMNVLGISCITNYGAGILDQPLSHAEVIETTEKTKVKFKELMRTIISKI